MTTHANGDRDSCSDQNPKWQHNDASPGRYQQPGAWNGDLQYAEAICNDDYGGFGFYGNCGFSQFGGSSFATSLAHPIGYDGNSAVL